ncbi:Cytochrome c [Thalassoglobus polymorphus]|uniref:Cytochrome c n=2 Tax=Thalassoglobus polymorphus TaxID=2527994 RepID=A0A517QRU8_9PLAN|nr:Cytochrome c [Thalassoglobus polymorphus]
MPASEQYWRSLPQMHKVFAASAVLLLGTTLLMMYKDESRSWKKYQKQGEIYRYQRIEEELEQYDDAEYQKNVQLLKDQIAEYEGQWTDRSDEIKELESKLTRLEGQVEILKTKSKSRNAFRDKARADYDIAVRDNASPDVLSNALKAFEEAKQSAQESSLAFQQAVANYDAVKSELDSKRSQLTEAESALTKAQLSQNALEEQKQLLKPDSAFRSFKRWMKELPIIEGFNPHLKIQYDWPSGLNQQLGMVSVGRVDRCRTCHVNIDDFSVTRKDGEIVATNQTYVAEKYPQPFVSHPNPELFLTSTSPHPVNSFGCTICHAGDGSGTSFQNAEHTPSDPAIAEEWASKHDWHSNHFWEAPMYPNQFIESTCLKCHHDVVELGENEKYGATAPKVVKGWETIRDYGCFGCHEINGYDGTTPIGPDLRLEPNTPEELAAIEADPNMIAGDMRKVGPSLRHIDSKLTPEFVAYWTEEPKRFRPDTRMPQFFDLTNQHDEMAALLQPMELLGIAKYLEAKSQEFDVQTPKDDYKPDAKRGEDLFAKRGCLACHSKQDEAFAGVTADFGPDLSKIHEKIKPGEDGFNWLYTWIKQPSLYHTRTKMPDLYLDTYTEGETTIDPAADIAAYLLEGGAREFPALPKPENDLGLVFDHDFSLEKAKSIGLGEEGFRGLLIQEVIQGSAAQRAQVQIGENWEDRPLVPGDIVISINGTSLKSIQELKEIVHNAKVGEEVKLVVLRNRKEITTRLFVSTPADDLVLLYLGKSLDKPGVEKTLEQRRFPVTSDMFEDNKTPANFIKGDEIELAPLSMDEEVSPEEWEKRKLVYIGRRTIARYGCYGCHDIPGFETARPIGTALQDWGHKDTSKLAFEHIHEFLHHHGEISETPASEDAHGDDHHGSAALGTSTAARMEKIVKDSKAGDPNVTDQDLTEAMLYKSAISHGRAGFLWQKLRQPRSYDYKKTETKNWDERLRMPKFPFNPEQIEAVSTFVLGLVAQPPAPEFQFQPNKEQEAIFGGERLLAKFNCTGCHVLEMDSVEFEYDPKVLAIKGQDISEADMPAFDLLQHIKPVGSDGQGATGEVTEDGSVVYNARGFIQGVPDPEEEDPEFRFYSYRFWDGFQLDDGKFILPSEAVQIGESQIRKFIDGRGGDFGKWLVNRLAPELSKTPGGNDFNAAWQASVPPLTSEGYKVQTPWLYRFLKNPEPIRRTTVLRMPRFNMSDEEAQTLANYFSAKDGVPFPYQTIPQNQLDYQAQQANTYHSEFPDAEIDYLSASWNVLNGPLCRKCHNVGGNVVNDPKQVKGPNLQRVESRLRPEWTQLWVYKPMWVYPYTAMPENFPSDKPAEMKKMFGGENPRQAQSVIDALFNYADLIEVHGETTYNPESATPPAQPGGAE